MTPSFPLLTDDTSELIIVGSRADAVFAVFSSNPSLLAILLVNNWVAKAVTGLEPAAVLPVNSEVSWSIPEVDWAFSVILPTTESVSPLSTLSPKLLEAAEVFTWLAIRSVNTDIVC